MIRQLGRGKRNGKSTACITATAAIAPADPSETTLRVLAEELPRLSPKIQVVPVSNIIHVIG